MTRNNQRTIHLFFFFLLLISIVFAYERIINTDAAYYLFKLIHFEKFNIEHDRYSAFISQLLILPLIRAGIDLKILIYLYSVSFVLLFYVLYLIIRYVLKDERTPFILVFTLVVGLSHPHYRPVSESTQGLVYAMLLPGILALEPGGNRHKSGFLKLTYSLVILLLCYFSHPITIFPLLFILIMNIFEGNNYKSYLPYAIIAGTLFLFLIKYLTGTSSSYEGDKLINLNELSTQLKSFFSLYPTRFYLSRIPTIYLVPVSLFILNMFVYLKNKKIIKAIILAGTCGLFFLIHNIIYLGGGADIELEKNFMTLNFFIYFAFFKDIFFNLKLRLNSLFFILIIFCFSIWTSLRASETYTKRISYHDRIYQSLSSLEGKKYFTYDDELSEDLLFSWGIGVETLIYSAAQSRENVLTLYSFSNKEKLPNYIDDPNLYLCVPFWEKWDIKTLNERYFSLPETKYEFIELSKKNYP